jgi:hypothetical protein
MKIPFRGSEATDIQKGNDNQRYHQSTVWLAEHRLISISSHFLRWFSAAPAVETGKN